MISVSPGASAASLALVTQDRESRRSALATSPMTRIPSSMSWPSGNGSSLSTTSGSRSGSQLGAKRNGTGHALTAVKFERAEAMGSVQHDQNLLRSGRPVRIVVPDFRPASAYGPQCSATSQRDESTARRYACRPRKPTPEQEAAIRSRAETMSLRSLAAEFGVSHETVRAVCHRSGQGA